jgi:hypothetical protein
MKGFEQFQHPTLNQLPLALKGALKAGWYEGSVFFLMMGELLLPFECLTLPQASSTTSGVKLGLLTLPTKVLPGC